MCEATYEKLKSWRASAPRRTDRREEHAREGGEERVCRRLQKAPAPAVGGVAARKGRVGDETERDDERGAPQAGHQDCLFVYLDGHFVTSLSATKTPFWSDPSTETSRPVLKRSGTEPR